MASSKWRMNGLWRMAGVLVLFTLLLSSEVICQDDVTDAPAVDATVAPDAADPAADPAATAGASAAPEAGSAPTGAVSLAPGDASLPFTVINKIVDGDATLGTSVPSAGDLAGVLVENSDPGKNVASDGDSSSSSSSSGSSVFVGILVTGLLAALAITIGYFKCQRRPEKKAVKLGEEAYPVDQENQGNTLVSVAPLNPPPETPEKPSVNGESTEAPKTPPPTNGHSTAKAADTEL